MSNQIRPRGDITCIPTGEGWLYPAIVKGLCTGKRVGYAFSSPIDTAPTLEALGRAARAASGGMNEPLPECQGFILLFQVFCVRVSGEGLKDKTLRHFHSCERALKPCSDSF